MAEKAIQLDIVTPDKLAYSSEVDEVVLSGVLGEFGVLPGHTPFLSELKVGPMHLRKEGRVEWFALNSGIAEVTPHKVTVLVKTAESQEEIDLRRAEEALKRAEERLEAKKEGIDMLRAEAALQRAVARIKVTRL